MVKSLIKSELNALRDGLGDGISDDLVNFLLNSLGWVRGNLDGFTVKKFGSEAEVVTALILTSVSTSEESLVSALRVSFASVSSEAEGCGGLLTTLLNLAFVLGHGTGELIVVVGASLDSVLGSGVTAVAGSLLNLGLFLQGWDDGLSNVAGLEVGTDSRSIRIDKLVVSSEVSSVINAKDIVLKFIALEELVGVVSIITESIIMVRLSLGQVGSSERIDSIVGE